MLDWMYRLIFPSETPDVTQSLVVLLLAISIGFFVGRIKVKGITLGVSAVMFVGLGLGHYGYRINAAILEFVRNFGLILFVYGIGIQVGPSFFSSFKKEGIRFNILAVATVLFGGFITFLLFKFSTISIENAVGLMSGSVTNTPGLGAAKETLTEIQNQFPSKSFSDPTIAYAITYPLGVFGIIITIILAKTLLKINLGKESFTCDATTTPATTLIIHQKCRVTNEAFFGKSIYQVLKEVNIQDIIISRLKNSGSQVVYAPSLDTKIHNKDVIMVVGSPAAVSQFIEAVGKVSSDLFIESEKNIANYEKKLLEHDFLSLFGGLIIGMIIGSIPFFIPSLPVPIKLGFAAGPLLTALFISRYGGVGVIHSYINNGAVYFMKDLGICLFFAAVGVHAGAGFYDNFIQYNGWLWIYYGCFITFIPLIAMVLIGRLVLKLNFYQLVGLMSGTYTDPAALAFSTKYLDSDIPTQAYATVYPLVTIFRIFVAQLLILLLV